MMENRVAFLVGVSSWGMTGLMINTGLVGCTMNAVIMVITIVHRVSLQSPGEKMHIVNAPHQPTKSSNMILVTQMKKVNRAPKNLLQCGCQLPNNTGV